MSRSRYLAFAFVVGLAAMSAGLWAQAAYNPYHVSFQWDKLPGGMKFGALTGAYPDPDGKHMWMLGRCGGNNCAGTKRDPILKFDLDGNLVTSFGAGLFAFTHGFYLDHEGFLWVTEGAPDGDDRVLPGLKLPQKLGHQVHKVNQQGKIVMSLGQAGVFGCDATHFNGPANVIVDRSGNIWVADGHRGGNNRLVKFSRDGKFLFQRGGCVGSESKEAGKFDDPHGLAMDSAGRIFVADRGNSRIQIFNQDGDLQLIWTQFGKPSGIVIDRNDVVYSVDGLSGVERPGWRDNFGWERGTYIGDAKTGWVTAFIPNIEPAQGAGNEFLGVDFQGNIYLNDIARESINKFVLFRPLAGRPK